MATRKTATRKKSTGRKKGSRKGKVPPQLKAYLFKKGSAPSATKSKRKSTSKRAPASSAKGRSRITVKVNGKTVHSQ